MIAVKYSKNNIGVLRKLLTPTVLKVESRIFHYLNRKSLVDLKKSKMARGRGRSSGRPTTTGKLWL